MVDPAFSMKAYACHLENTLASWQTPTAKYCNRRAPVVVLDHP
jgi:hypothetical protein